MKQLQAKQFLQLTLAAILGGALVLLGNYFFNPSPKVVIQQSGSNYKGLPTKYDAIKEGILDFSQVAESVTPAVVHIKSTITTRPQARGGENNPFRDFFGEEFFNPRDLRQMPQQGSGSGVIISKDGYIVTNNHVIEGAEELEVVLYDKRSYKAKVIGVDPSTDLALIQIKEKDLPTLTLGNSDQVKVGEWVLAVGNPFNLTSTVTAGIVSAKGRNINILQEQTAIEAFIQTDAAVNPGNSGGALVNLNGELVGINTAIASRTGSYSGYSFAVPTNIVSKVVKDLMEFGSVQRGFLGIMIRDVDANLVETEGLKLDVSEGVYVAEVQTGGAAEAAGLKKGDVIIEINGRKVKSTPELQELVGRKRPGDSVELKIIRAGKTQILKVVLKDRSGNTQVAAKPASPTLANLGADFEDLNKSDKAKLDLKGGVKVKKLYSGILRSQTKMREGFIITKLNNTTISSVKDLEEALAKLEKGGGVLLEGIYEDTPGAYYYGFGM